MILNAYKKKKISTGHKYEMIMCEAAEAIIYACQTEKTW